MTQNELLRNLFDSGGGRVMLRTLMESYLECVLGFVYGKAKQMDGRGMNIPDNFPHLYMALVVNEISQDPHFDKMFKDKIDAEMEIFDLFNKSS